MVGREASQVTSELHPFVKNESINASPSIGGGMELELHFESVLDNQMTEPWVEEAKGLL